MPSKKTTIISFNVKGAPSSATNTYYRLQKIGKRLNSNKADVINFQEVFTNKHLNVLSNTLTNFPHINFKKHLIGPRGGLVTFSKIPTKKVTYKPYSSVVFFRPALIRQFIRNIFTGKGMLTTEFSNSKIVVINTHLSANRGGDWSSQSHYSPLHTKQIAELSRYINSIKRKDYIFFSGDLNIPKTSSFYKDLVSKTNSIDLFEKHDFPTFHKEFLFKGEKGHRLDFIFLKTSKKHDSIKKQHIFTKQTIQKTVNKGFVSDHIGLMVTVSLP